MIWIFNYTYDITQWNDMACMVILFIVVKKGNQAMPFCYFMEFSM